MSERTQTRRCNESATCPLISNKSKQSKLLNKNSKSLRLHPPLIQAKLAINQPGDKYEQEADRIAEAVVHDGQNAGAKSISGATSPLIQRQEQPKPEQSSDEKLKKSAEKTGEAFLKTGLGREIKEKALKMGMDFIETLYGKVITGAVAVSTITLLAATNSELPMQPPEIPLDIITPGLKVKLTYEGPVQNPKAASITFIFEENVRSEEKKGMTEAEKSRSENARIAADQERFREGLKSPEQRAKEKAQFERAFWGSRNRLGLKPFDIPGLRLEDEWLQRKEADNSPTDSFIPPIVHEVLSSPGQPLDSATRAFMEPRFGYDFSRVRIHTDAKAAESARIVNARAFTVGKDIVFGAGEYAPDMSKGQRLLTHELTHTLQQSFTNSLQSQIKLGTRHDKFEQEARTITNHVLKGAIPLSFSVSQLAPMIQRQESVEVELEAPTPREAEKIRQLGCKLPQVSAQSVDPRNRADYIDKRLRAVGFGIYIGGYYLYCDGIDLPLFLPEGHVDFALMNATPVNSSIYSDYDSAVADIPYGPPAPNQAIQYAYYQGTRGTIVPTIFSPATTPRVIATAKVAMKELAEQVQDELVILALSLIGGAILRGVLGRIARVGETKPNSPTRGRLQQPESTGGGTGEITEPQLTAPGTKQAPQPQRTQVPQTGTRGNQRSSVKAASERQPAEPTPLTQPQKIIRDTLLKEHPGLNSRVAADASKGAEKAMGPGGKGADVKLSNGGGREISVHQGAFTSQSIGSHLQAEAIQVGTTEVYIQINSVGASREGLLKMIQLLRNAYPELRNILIKFYGPNGNAWWSGIFRGPL